jgi:predicted DNA-binding transcriptional regulator YafY
MRAEGRYARIEHEYSPDADGWIRVDMMFEEEHSAVEYVLSYGPRIEVLEPPALREEVIRQAESVVAFYAQRLLPSPMKLDAPNQA